MGIPARGIRGGSLLKTALAGPLGVGGGGSSVLRGGSRVSIDSVWTISAAALKVGSGSFS